MPDTLREIPKVRPATLLSTVFLLYHWKKQSARGYLVAVVPSTVPGAVQIGVTDPAGHSYSLDNAFTAQ